MGRWVLCQTVFHVEQCERESECGCERESERECECEGGCEGEDSWGRHLFHVEQTSRMSPIWVQYRIDTAREKTQNRSGERAVFHHEAVFACPGA